MTKVYLDVYDTNKQGINILELIKFLQLNEPTIEADKKLIRLGNISINKEKIKDINYQVMPGKYLIVKEEENTYQRKAEVMIL